VRHWEQVYPVAGSLLDSYLVRGLGACMGEAATRDGHQRGHQIQEGPQLCGRIIRQQPLEADGCARPAVVVLEMQRLQQGLHAQLLPKIFKGVLGNGSFCFGGEGRERDKCALPATYNQLQFGAGKRLKLYPEVIDSLRHASLYGSELRYPSAF